MKKKKSKKTPLVHPPFLQDYKGDVSKRRYIDYWVYNPESNEFKKHRYWIPSVQKTKAQRTSFAKEALEEITRIVESVFIKETTKTFDVERLTVQQAINYYLNYKNDTLEGYGKEKLCTTFNPQTPRFKFNSWTEYKNVLGDLLRWLNKQGLGGILLKNLNAHLCRSYMEYLKTKRKISNKRYNVIRGFLFSFFKFYIHLEDLPLSNPILKIETVRYAKNSEKHPPFTLEQLKQISDYCQADPSYHQLLLFIRFIYYTLARPYEEIGKLQVKDIEDKCIIIKAENSKNRLRRRIPISPALEEEIQRYRLREYPEDAYIFGAGQNSRHNQTYPVVAGNSYRSDTSFYNQHRKVLTDLKIEGYTLYGYKHTGAIALYRACRDIVKVRDMCGHASVSTTEIYLRGIGAIEEYTVEVERF